jgi:hypothetical protein
MAYSVGGLIQASDINAWLNTINTVYGTGSGDRGYGQSSLQAAVAAGNTITSSHWTSLRTMMTRCATHQGTTQTNLVPEANLGSGQTVRAHISGSAPNNFDIADLVAAIDTNRLTGSAAMSLTSGAHTLTRGSAWTTTINCNLDVVFSNEDHARYFFNTGGEIRVRLTATSTLASSSASQDVDWRDVITNKVGTVTLRGRATTRSGSAGTIQSGGGGTQGFYGLNGTQTLIYNGNNIGGTGYTTNDVLVSARVLNVAGTNGGNGNTIRFTIQLNDDHTNANYDSVAAGMTANIDFLKVGTTNLPVAISNPTFATNTTWSGS